jgi:hypothetical protein
MVVLLQDFASCHRRYSKSDSPFDARFTIRGQRNGRSARFTKQGALDLGGDVPTHGFAKREFA